MTEPAWTLVVLSQLQVEQARREVRRLALSLSFHAEEAESLVLAVSELASNLVRHARGGTLTLSILEGDRSPGIEVECLDNGPGIPNLELAMQDGYSTSGGLGSGLPAARRHTDDFEVETSPAGTRIVARKWHRPR